jgi:hypothetical protein
VTGVDNAEVASGPPRLTVREVLGVKPVREVLGVKRGRPGGGAFALPPGRSAPGLCG